MKDDDLQVLKTVHDFFDASFTRLLWVLGAAFTVIGVVMPVLIQVYQINQASRLQKEMEDRLKTQTEDYNTLNDRAVGAINMMHGEIALIASRNGHESRYGEALKAFSDAVPSYLRVNEQTRHIDPEDMQNGRASITNVEEILRIPGLKSTPDLKLGLDAVDTLLRILSDSPLRRFYEHDIQEIRSLVDSMKE
jgi:hypothetical protein